VVRLFRPFALFLVVAGAQLIINDSLALETSRLGTDAPALQLSGVELNQQGLSGSFYDPATSGQGFEVEVFPNFVAPDIGLIQVGWFTFDTTAGGADHQRWYTLSGNVQTGQPAATVTIYQNVGGNFNSLPATTAVAVGTATIRFDTCTSGQLDYTFTDGSDRSGSIPLTRLTQSATCSTTSARPTNSDSALGGNWFDAATSGQGFIVDVSPGSATLFFAWYTYAPTGSGDGTTRQRWYSGQGTFSPGMQTIPVTLYATTGGVFDSSAATAQSVAVGNATLVFQSCSSARLTFSFTGGSSSGASGSIALTRIGPVPPGCAIGTQVPGQVPVCVVTPSDSTPNVGSALTLTAACSNSPSAFTWTGCTSATSTCVATSAAAGQVAYSVVARNAAGPSAPAGVTVSWQAAGAVAKCTLARTSQTDPPLVNSSVVLAVTCDKAVGSYTWNGCSSTSNICIARETTPGPHTYSVFARTSAGASDPATMTLPWVSSPPSPPGLCAQFPSYLYGDVGSQSARLESARMINPPAFAWNGVFTVRFVVPSTIGTRVGRLSAAEFAGEPTVREATISKTPCDFRATDPSGANGPVSRTSGISVTNFFTADPSRPGYPVLQPGGTYYYNLRNFNPSGGTISCPSSPGRCDAFIESLLPR